MPPIAKMPTSNHRHALGNVLIGLHARSERPNRDFSDIANVSN